MVQVLRSVGACDPLQVVEEVKVGRITHVFRPKVGLNLNSRMTILY